MADRTFVLDIIFIPTALVCFFLQRCNCCSLYKYLCPALISNKLSVHPDQRGGRPCIGDQSLDKAIRFTIIYRREEDKQLRLCLSPHSKQALKLSMDSGDYIVGRYNSLPRLVNVSDWRVITQKYAYGVQTVLHSIHRRIRQRPGISRIYLGQETLTS